MATASKKKPDLEIIFGMGGKPSKDEGGELPPLPEDDEMDVDDMDMEPMGMEDEAEEPEGDLDDTGKELAAKALGSESPEAAQALKDFVSHCMKTYG